MNRIKPTALIRIFKTHGLQPIRAKFVDYEGGRLASCCAMSALIVDQGLDPLALLHTSLIPVVPFAEACGLPIGYVAGFMSGWDGRARGTYTQFSKHPGYDSGYDDGKVSWKRVTAAIA